MATSNIKMGLKLIGDTAGIAAGIALTPLLWSGDLSIERSWIWLAIACAMTTVALCGFDLLSGLALALANFSSSASQPERRYLDMAATGQRGGSVKIDVGADGIYGFYAQLRSQLATHLAPALILLGVWLWAVTWPQGFFIYELTPDVSVVGIIKLALALFAAKSWWHVVKGLWFGLRWLRLEAQGLHWVQLNEHSYRVTFYRSDGSLQYDKLTRQQRLDQEVSSIRHRRQVLLRGAPVLAALVIGFLLIPAGIDVVNAELRYFDWGASVIGFLQDWHEVEAVQWLWFFFGIVPKAVPVALVVLDELIYRSGAQFIPGAKVLDPVRPPRTLESIHDQRVHGAADFVPADDAANRMSGS